MKDGDGRREQPGVINRHVDVPKDRKAAKLQKFERVRSPLEPEVQVGKRLGYYSRWQWRPWNGCGFPIFVVGDSDGQTAKLWELEQPQTRFDGNECVASKVT